MFYFDETALAQSLERAAHGVEVRAFGRLDREFLVVATGSIRTCRTMALIGCSAA